jgi:hypothetical protein
MIARRVLCDVGNAQLLLAHYMGQLQNFVACAVLALNGQRKR